MQMNFSNASLVRRVGALFLVGKAHHLSFTWGTLLAFSFMSISCCVSGLQCRNIYFACSLYNTDWIFYILALPHHEEVGYKTANGRRKGCGHIAWGRKTQKNQARLERGKAQCRKAERNKKPPLTMKPFV
jgi:hypothetical protein